MFGAAVLMQVVPESAYACVCAEREVAVVVVRLEWADIATLSRMVNAWSTS